MATIKGSVSKGSYSFYMEVVEKSTSISDNTSSVSWKLYIKNNGGRFNGDNYVVKASINGGSVYSETRTINTTTIGFQDALLLASGTTTVGHNTDGTKTMSVSASISRSYYSSYDAGYCSLSGNVTLTTIPRYFTRTPSLSVSKGDSETNLSCSWSTSETCDYVQYKIGDGSWNNVGSVNTTSGSFTVDSLGAGTSYTITIQCRRKDSQLWSSSSAATQTTYSYPYLTGITPAESTTWNMSGSTATLGATLYNPLGRTVSVTVYVGGGSISLGSTATTSISKSVSKNDMNSKITDAQSAGILYRSTYGSVTSDKRNTYQLIESDCRPTIGALSYDDANTTTRNLIGNNGQTLVQNLSQLSAKVGACSYKYGASIKSLVITLDSRSTGNISGNPTAAYNMGTFNYGSGTKTLTATLTDSRGWSVSTTKTVTFIGYTAPTLNATVKRNGGYGTNATLTISADYSSLDSKNSWSNNGTAYVQYKIDDGSVVNVVNTHPINNKTIALSNMDTEKIYTIVVYASDKLTPTTAALTLEKGVPILSILKNPISVGVNCIPDEGYIFQANGKTKISGELDLTKTSYNYNNGAIPGTKLASSTTIEDLLEKELRYTNGQMGSVNLNTAYSKDGVTISAAWYNYIYIPHRDGGSSGEESGDNCNYGILTLMGMSIDSPIYTIRFSSGAIATLKAYRSALDMYPVGAIYMSYKDTSPASLFGGTWTQIKNRFVFATNATNGDKGTESTHTGTSTSSYTLTANDIPSHTHTISSSGGHNHNAYFKEVRAQISGQASSDCARKKNSTGNNSDGQVTISNGAHTHSPASVGGDGGHSHSVSYVELYVWKRTE